MKRTASLVQSSNKRKKLAVIQLEQLSRLAPKKMRLAAEWNSSWKVLISTILSVQTRDETTIKVCKALFSRFKDPKSLGCADIKEIESIVRPVNYHKTKSKNIQQPCRIISDKKIPRTVDKLLLLPGVGRKTANVFLAEFHKKAAIGVDTHVARISQKIGWTRNTDRFKIEKDLKELFPRRYWRRINYILVKFGRSIGKKRKEEDKILNKIKSQAYRN
jgi:endonuclease-3